MASTAGPAFAKGHLQPADPAQAFGQENADENYVIGGETAAVLARDETPGVDGSFISMEAQTVEREPADPPKGKPE
ncbi:MAG: hypothetical protein ACR2JJ_04875 [Sphingomicrobium sp.]